MNVYLLYNIIIIIFLSFFIIFSKSYLSLNCMSFNIRSGGDINNNFNLEKQANIIVNSKVHLVGLQEDNLTRRHLIDEATELSKLTKMEVIYGKMRNYEGGEYGIAILSKYKIKKSKIFRYHNPNITMLENQTPPEQCSNEKPKDFCQGALAIKININENLMKDIWFVTTHIGLYNVEFIEIKQLFHEFLVELNKEAPVILTGDFNSIPNSPQIQYLIQNKVEDTWLTCGKGNGFTFNSSIPFERIDYQFIYNSKINNMQIKCEDSMVVVTTTSDHRPIITKYLIN